jgi:EAL domain-containing protein (putative c-di-GMP-specific phosphodiesterase class I)/DNA-binding response OmpR family regulator
MNPAPGVHTGPILVVDDDPSVRTILALALRRAGLDTVEASSGEEALEIIARETIGVVVCDVRMRGATGIDIVRMLRQRPETSTLPFILTTGSGDADSVIAGLEAGADDFLSKPVRTDELVARVRAHLRTHAAWTQVVEQELRTRADAVQAIGQLALSSVPEEAAEAIVTELAARTDSEFVGVLQLTSGSRLAPLARHTRTTGLVKGGPGLPPSRTRDLLERALEGPRVEEVTTDPGDAIEPFWGGRVDLVASAPIYGGDAVVGLLALGVVPVQEGPAPSARQSSLLASVIDYAGVLSAVAGIALADRRQAAAEQARLRHMLSDHAFHAVYQPIVALETATPVGYEALTRFADGTRPDIRFAEAAAAGLGYDFQLAAVQTAIDDAGSLPAECFLSLNVAPELVVRSGRRLGRVLAAAQRDVVLEVTEHARITDYETFRRAVGRLNDFRLAVDDAGAGYASLRHILELGPAYAKLDITLVQGIDGDPLRQALAAGLSYFARQTGCRLIAEGVEHQAQADALKTLGVEFAQGYLFGRPTRAVAA